MNIRRSATRAVVFALVVVGGFQPLTSQERGEPRGADSLYREARLLLNQRSYERALELFRRVQREHAASEFSAQSAYWEAYSLYRLGGEERLHEALAVLRQRLREGETATGHRDAAELRARISSLLAERGEIDGLDQLREDAMAEDGCDREALGVRMEALRALSRLRPESTLPNIVRILERRDECGIELRRQAVMLILEVASGAEADSIMANVIRTDPAIEVKLAALLVMGSNPSESSVSLLAATAREHESQRMRQQATMALARINSEAAVAVLRDIASNEDAYERDRLVAIVELSASSSNVDFLRDLYSSARSLELKSQIIQMLGRANAAGSADWLMGIARDTAANMALRGQALLWAAQNEVDLSSLIEMYQAEQDLGLVANLVMVISRYHLSDPRALDIMIDVARNSEYPGLRRRAIAMLAQSDSPRAAEALVELLEQ